MKECNKTGKWGYGSGMDLSVSCQGNDDEVRPEETRQEGREPRK